MYLKNIIVTGKSSITTLPNLYKQKYRNGHILHEIQKFLPVHFTVLIEIAITHAQQIFLL